MESDLELLDLAEECLKHELEQVRRERDALTEFREVVSRFRPGDRDAKTVTTESENLLQMYRETVLTADYEDEYGDVSRESLETEFTASIANTLTSSEPFTQRSKRNLLVAVTEAIERRRGFEDILEGERESIQ